MLSRIITLIFHQTLAKDDVEDDPNTPMVTTHITCYDHETTGTVRFLEPKLIEINCKETFIKSLKQNVPSYH